MHNDNELERFLRVETSEGKRISEGQFTISKQQALAKLSEFQLPFEGAWGLKLVQAAVASKQGRGIKVKIGRKSTHFDLEGDLQWTLAEIESALLDPQYNARRDILHLVAALRSVGLSSKRGFWLGLPHEQMALAWDGEELRTVEQNEPLDLVSVQVTNRALGEDGGFLNYKLSRIITERNAALTQCMTMMAHTCPLPLLLDGRRIDALEYNQDHGWGKTSQLLCVGFEDGKLPELPVPQATGAVISATATQDDLKAATAIARQRDQNVTKCSLAFLVAVHLERVKSGKNYRWEDREFHSFLNWVRDGVIVETETISEHTDLCSVGCFVSADDLQTDLTSFKLLSAGKGERREEVLQLLRESLDDVERIDFEKMYKKADDSAAIIGGLLLVVGMGSFVVSWVHGFAFLAGGILTWKSGGAHARKKGERISRALNRLKSNLILSPLDSAKPLDPS